MDKRPIFPYILEIHLVDHCDLNCKGCSHFSPLVRGEVFANIEDFTKDLQRFSELFSDIYEIRLMGGEPLLHPEINQFIENARQIFPKSKLGIFSNGLLIKKMPEHFWQTCHTNHAHIKLTKYPIKLDIKSIRRLAKKHHVRIKIPKQIDTFYKFINIKGDSDPQKSFRTCRATHMCPFLRDGKLFTCSFTPHVHIFNQYFEQNIPVTDGDFLDIYKDVTPEEIFEFLAHPTPLCRWCDVQRAPFDWGISIQDIHEWIDGDTNKFAQSWFFAKKSAISLYHHIKHTFEIRTRK